MISLTSQDLLLAHIIVAHKLKYPVLLSKPEILVNIEKQLDTNLGFFSDSQKIAYIGIMLYNNQPFKYVNKATTVAVVL